MRSSTDNSFYRDIFNFFPNKLSFLTWNCVLNLFENACDTPLMACVHFFIVFVLFKVIRLFIDRVICKVDKEVVHVSFEWWAILSRRKPRQPFSKDKNT